MDDHDIQVEFQNALNAFVELHHQHRCADKTYKQVSKPHKAEIERLKKALLPRVHATGKRGLKMSAWSAATPPWFKPIALRKRQQAENKRQKAHQRNAAIAGKKPAPFVPRVISIPDDANLDCFVRYGDSHPKEAISLADLKRFVVQTIEDVGVKVLTDVDAMIEGVESQTPRDYKQVIDVDEQPFKGQGKRVANPELNMDCPEDLVQEISDWQEAELAKKEMEEEYKAPVVAMKQDELVLKTTLTEKFKAYAQISAKAATTIVIPHAGCRYSVWYGTRVAKKGTPTMGCTKVKRMIEEAMRGLKASKTTITTDTLLDAIEAEFIRLVEQDKTRLTTEKVVQIRRTKGQLKEGMIPTEDDLEEEEDEVEEVEEEGQANE